MEVEFAENLKPHSEQSASLLPRTGRQMKSKTARVARSPDQSPDQSLDQSLVRSPNQEDFDRIADLKERRVRNPAASQVLESPGASQVLPGFDVDFKTMKIAKKMINPESPTAKCV